MPSPEVLEFAKVLVQEVRDRAVQSCDLRLCPHAKGPSAARWRAAGTSDGGIRADVLIPDCVDMVLFYLLDAIDNGLLKVRFEASTGKVVDLTTEGHWELAGWYIGGRGWRDMYSKERFVDDTADFA